MLTSLVVYMMHLCDLADFHLVASRPDLGGHFRNTLYHAGRLCHPGPTFLCCTGQSYQHRAAVSKRPHASAVPRQPRHTSARAAIGRCPPSRRRSTGAPPVRQRGCICQMSHSLALTHMC